MTKPRLLLLIALVLSWTSAPLSWAANKPKAEQTNFGAEGDFNHPVQLPPDALRALRDSKSDDDMVQRCAEEEDIRPEDIPDNWFVASKITIHSSQWPAFVVRGETGCLRGAHIAQFWVVAKSAAGYRIIFRGRGDGFGVLRTRTNGYRDLDLVLISGAGTNITDVTFKYSNGEYRVARERTGHRNDK